MAQIERRGRGRHGLYDRLFPFYVRSLTTVERDRAPVCVNTGALVRLLHSTVSSCTGGTLASSEVLLSLCTADKAEAVLIETARAVPGS